MSSGTLQYIAFLKIFLSTGFIILLLDLSRHYDGYRAGGATHLDVLNLTFFSWFFVLPIVLGLAGVSVVTVNLMRRMGLRDTLFKGVVQAALTTILGFTFVRTLMLLPVGPFRLVYDNYWHEYKVIPLGVIVLLLYVQRGGALKQWFDNMVELLWIPSLSLSLGALIWIGPSLIAFGIAEWAKGTEVASGNKPNVFLITFDSLTARDMSLYGYHKKTTPCLDELAKESFVFENMHSNSDSTSTSLPSILAGTYPWTHGAKDSDDLTIDLRGALSQETESIANCIEEYYTVALVSTGWDIAVKAQFDQCDLMSPGRLGAFFSKVCGNEFHPKRPPMRWALRIFGWSRKEWPPFNAEAMQHLDRLEKRPFLMWIHVWPPHHPYLPPPPFMGVFLPAEERDANKRFRRGYTYNEESEQPYVDKMRARYDEYILYADACLRSFIEGLKEKGLYDNSLIIITSDHGESFEKGFLSHGNNPQLPEPEMHIPLLIRLPGQSHGSRISTLAEQVDVAPTILDVLGKPIPYWMEGKSLLPYMSGKNSNDDKVTYSTNGETMAVFKGDYKLIRLSDGTEKLYNLKKDPGELENLIIKESDVAAQLSKLVSDLEIRKAAN